MGTPIYHVDAFTDRPFAGNPAAVCLLRHEADPAWMQRIAAEMNLSETAFVRLPTSGTSAVQLRWFTPAAEVELCGHATLASAHVLWETGLMGRRQPIAFQTRSRGVLTCTQDEAGLIAMDFPADPAEPADPPPGLLEALGLGEQPIVERVARSRYDWIVELASEAAVRAVVPDFTALAHIEARGVAVTAPARRPGCDIVSRFFAPRLRIAEDPVTGSIHCVLGPYWQTRLGEGRNVLTAEQASPRGGRLRVSMHGDRVELAGHAVTLSAGELRM